MRQFFNIKKNTAHCNQYLDDPFVLDLSNYPASFYNPRDRILGDLKCLGWVLLMGMKIDKETQCSLDAVSSSSKWYPIENLKRSLKYKLVNPMHRNWRIDNRMVT